MNSFVKANGILDALRSLILIVGDHGEILEAYGGFGGLMGLDISELPGTSVFDHVHPDDVDELAVFFLEARAEQLETIAVPMPFRMRVCPPDGLVHQVDVIASGVADEDGSVRWTTEVMPVELYGSTTRSLDLELEGASHDEVCRMLCEELAVDNENYTSRWVLIDRRESEAPTFTTSRSEDADVVAAVEADVAAGWTPWDGVAEGESQSLDLATVGTETLRLIDRRGWHRVIVSPVVVERRVVAAFLLLGSVPAAYRADDVKANVAARIQRLVRTTAMLFERWAAQDRLAVAASTDDLTGLANRRTFFAALDAERRTGAVLFVDVDDFKIVNDTCGHQVGDRVLSLVADRIAAACRAEDLVARLGGDEFVVLARGADEMTASELATRIVDTVERPLGLGAEIDAVTVSIGHAPFGGADGRRAIDVADAAMLGRKRPTRRLQQSS